MNKFFKLILLSIIILTTIHSAFAVIDMLSFEASLFDSTGSPINGNITIEIYDAATGGNLIYNSTEDFIDNVIDINEVKYEK